MANYVFKQFCSELDAASLDHLLEIIAKPGVGADEMEADSQDSSDEEGESDDEQIDIEDVSDDDSDQ